MEIELRSVDSIINALPEQEQEVISMQGTCLTYFYEQSNKDKQAMFNQIKYDL